jgi:hypothetical protein
VLKTYYQLGLTMDLVEEGMKCEASFWRRLEHVSARIGDRCIPWWITFSRFVVGFGSHGVLTLRRRSCRRGMSGTAGVLWRQFKMYSK